MKKGVILVVLMCLGYPNGYVYSSQNWLDKIYSKVANIDTNDDGVIDTWRKFSSKGDLLEVHFDTNFDRKKDKWVKYYKTKVIEKVDTDFDGHVDESLIEYFSLSVKGKKILVRKEKKKKNTLILTEDYIEEKKQIKKSYFKNGKINKVVYESAVRH